MPSKAKTKSSQPICSPWERAKAEGNPAYKTAGVEPIDLFKSGEMAQDFILGSIIKYAYRNRREHLQRKNFDPIRAMSRSDLKKIIHYAKLLLALQGEEA